MIEFWDYNWRALNYQQHSLYKQLHNWEMLLWLKIRPKRDAAH